MTRLTRVQPPHSSFDRWLPASGGLVLVTILALAVEPWGNTDAGAVPTPSPYVQGTRPQPTTVGRADSAPAPTRTYQPELFGPAPVDATWTIRTGARIVPLPSLDVAPSNDIASGPVVELGRPADLTAIVISAPPGTRLETARLWRFEEGRGPERLDLAEMAAPWTNVEAWAFGLRPADGGGASSGRVAGWRAGLYRLDLLIEPSGLVRTVMLSVAPDAGPIAAPTPATPDELQLAVFTAASLRRLPQDATLWTVGQILTGWARRSQPGRCLVSDLWLARGPEDRCWPVPIGPTSALGVNLTDGRRVAGIKLAEVDPLPGPVPLEARLAVGGDPGVAALETPAGGLPDGIYRMTVTVIDGPAEHWYVEVGPNGRRVAALNAFSINVQR